MHLADVLRLVADQTSGRFLEQDGAPRLRRALVARHGPRPTRTGTVWAPPPSVTPVRGLTSSVTAEFRRNAEKVFPKQKRIEVQVDMGRLQIKNNGRPAPVSVPILVTDCRSETWRKPASVEPVAEIAVDRTRDATDLVAVGVAKHRAGLDR